MKKCTLDYYKECWAFVVLGDDEYQQIEVNFGVFGPIKDDKQSPICSHSRLTHWPGPSEVVILRCNKL